MINCNFSNKWTFNQILVFILENINDILIINDCFNESFSSSLSKIFDACLMQIKYHQIQT